MQGLGVVFAFIHKISLSIPTLLAIKCYTEPRVKPSVPCILAPPFGQGPGASLHSFRDTEIPHFF